MVTANHSVEIDVPVSVAFDFLTTLDNYPLWQAGISKLNATDGFNPGSTIVFTSMGLGKTFNLSAQIVSNDGESSFSAISNRGPITFNSTYKIRPTKTGCRVQLTNNIETASLFALAEPALQAVANNRYQSDLNTLKIVLESNYASKLSQSKK